MLYLLNHTNPDVANSNQELSKVMNVVNKAAFPEMYKILKYVIDAKNLCLMIEPIKNEKKHVMSCVSVIATMQVIWLQEV